MGYTCFGNPFIFDDGWDGLLGNVGKRPPNIRKAPSERFHAVGCRVLALKPKGASRVSSDHKRLMGPIWLCTRDPRVSSLRNLHAMAPNLSCWALAKHHQD